MARPFPAPFFPFRGGLHSGDGAEFPFSKCSRVMNSSPRAPQEINKLGQRFVLVYFVYLVELFKTLLEDLGDVGKDFVVLDGDQ